MRSVFNMMLKEVITLVTNVKLNAFEIINDRVHIHFLKVNSKLFSHALDFMIYYAKQGKEVLIYLNRNSKEEWIFTVPKQIVTSADIQIDSRVDQINLLTGLPELGLFKLGSLHSHHTLAPKFSLKDDNSDLYGPPTYHIVVGNFPNLEIVSSAVYLSKRYYFPIQDLVDYKEKHIYKPEQLNRTIFRQVKVK